MQIAYGHLPDECKYSYTEAEYRAAGHHTCAKILPFIARKGMTEDERENAFRAMLGKHDKLYFTTPEEYERAKNANTNR